MPDFTYGDISCDFTNTFADEIAESAFLKACKVSQAAPINNEDVRDSWASAFCRIAAFSKNIAGMGAWSPPRMFADEEAIQDSMALFYAIAGHEAALAWTKAIFAARYGLPAAVLAEEQSTGDADVDSFQTGENASGSAT